MVRPSTQQALKDATQQAILEIQKTQDERHAGAVRFSALLLACITSLGSHPACAQNRSGYIETVGIGVQDVTIANKTQRRATAREAALTEAQAKMLSILQSRSSGGMVDQEKSRNPSRRRCGQDSVG